MPNPATGSASSLPPSSIPTRDKIASLYLDQLPFPPYPVQEEALLTYFMSEQGALICAPTGTGKTLIAEAALFEALHTGTRAYYTTPLIALTEQKLVEMQAAAVRWGFSADQIGLVTGNRRVNPNAPVLVVVAEILLNRLLHARPGDQHKFHEADDDLPSAVDFTNVSAVVMDEFHNFADLERGIVWELALGLLPPHVRLLLLSATVGNAFEFRQWLKASHERSLELVEGRERKVPLSYQWVGDQLLVEQIEKMTDGDEQTRYTPALLFCFSRDECWSIAEALKGKPLLASGQQKQLADELAKHDWSQGAGPKLKAILQRGVGVHHAGVLPKFRRVVEELFQKKLLAVCVCTETLAAGINLPARSVVMPTLLKGKPGEKKVIDPSSAHQIFGRAGRPQFDTQGYVFALAHEDDVKIARWKEKFDQIPENTKDPGLLRAKKDLKRKMPTRRSTEQYWNEQQWEKLKTAPPQKLYSRGPIPWRLLAYMLDASPEIEPLRRLVGKRLMDAGRLAAAQKQLEQMLMTLWAAGYVRLEPAPPPKPALGEKPAPPPKPEIEPVLRGLFAPAASAPPAAKSRAAQEPPAEPALPAYRPELAHPTENLTKLLLLRGVNPLYGVYLVNQLGIASREERIQAFESVLELPGSVAKFVRPPRYEEVPPGPLATLRLDEELLRMGLALPEQLGPKQAREDDEPRDRPGMFEERVWPLTIAEKLRLLFDAEFPHVHSLFTMPAWAAGEVLEFNGDFNKYVTARSLQKQEGVIFRHLLRLILLLKEFGQLTPPEVEPQAWQEELRDLADRLTASCRQVDPSSTDKALEDAAGDSAS